jgi:hypothetical protein
MDSVQVNPISNAAGVTFAPEIEAGPQEETRNTTASGRDSSLWAHNTKRTKSKEERAQEPNVTKQRIEKVLKRFNWLPSEKACFKDFELTFAQRSYFASLKASTGLIIIPIYCIFLGTLFWVVTYLFFIEAVRTNKSYKLLKEEGRGWIITGAIGLSIGCAAAWYLMWYLKQTFSASEAAALFKDEPVPDATEEEEESCKVLIQEMELPIKVSTYRKLMQRYFVFIDQTDAYKSDEIKELLVRSAVYFKNPLQFLMVVVCQILFCVVIGIFSYGHGSVGSSLVTALYIIYKLVCVAGKTISRTKNIITIAFSCIRDPKIAFPDLPEPCFLLLDDYDYGLCMLAVGFQAWVIAQALSISNETVITLNFENQVCSIVTLIVLVTSVCMAVLAPDALTAAGTLVTFEFVAQFDEAYIANAEKFLDEKDFKNIKRRSLYAEEWCLVLSEIIVMVAAGSSVTNSLVGLAF